MRGRRLFIAAFLLPPLLLYGVFVVSPYAQAFPIAATNWGGLSPDFDFVGLDNVRRILVERHGGSIDVTASPACTTFIARLPLRHA